MFIDVHAWNCSKKGFGRERRVWFDLRLKDKQLHIVDLLYTFRRGCWRANQPHNMEVLDSIPWF